MIKKILKSILKFGIPIGIWLYLFRSILSGAMPLLTEPYNVFAMVKFYIDNVRMGVFPLWNPYLLWGFPMGVILNYFGFANPLWIITFVLNLAGLKMYSAFVYTIVFYFLFGQIGFYQLAKAWIEDRRCAYVAFLCSLFSSIGLVQIAQLNMLFIYVPAVWFFTFFVRWVKRGDWASWVGMILSVMIILQSYLPIYFVILCMLFFVFSLLITPLIWGQWFRQFVRFLTQYPVRTLVSLMVLALAMIPPYLTYQMASHRDIVFPCRQDPQEVFKQGAAFTKYLQTSDGGISSRMSIDSLYSNPDFLLYGNDGFLYVSIFLIILILIGFINRVNRNIVFLTMASVAIFLLLLGKASGWHAFCFQYLPIFKLVRNMHFFLPFFIGLVSLLAAEHLRQLAVFSEHKALGSKGMMTVWTWVLHGIVAYYLFHQEQVFGPVWIGLGCSFLFFHLYLWRGGLQNRLTMGVLILGVIWQPIALIEKHNHMNNNQLSSILIRGEQAGPSQPHFSFTRPEIDFKNVSEREKINLFYSYFQGMLDAPMIPLSCQHGFPAYWSYYFYIHFPQQVVHDYTKFKFYLYDQLEIKSEDDLDIKDVVASIEKNKNLAYVYSSDDQARDLLKSLRDPSSKPSGPPVAIQQSWKMFTLKDSDPNSIKVVTDFPKDKFLVFTDSYLKGWKVFCNGHPVPCYRANLGFKGVFLPAGYQQVELIYQPAGWWIWVILPILYILMFFYLCVILL